MPPKPKTPKEIEQVRRKILDCALDITAKHGYDELSMRKMAARLGMSATNIYNYFHKKDEVYLAILTEGYEKLYVETYNAINLGENAKERLKNAIDAFVNFGLEKPYYYEIMFSSRNPKYLDYVGKPHENIAYNKKVIALKWFNCFTECVSECILHDFKDRDVKNVALQIIGQLHGVLNLFYNKVIIEVYDKPLEIIDNTKRYVIEQINL